MGLWNVSQHGLCDPDSLVQGHAFWHLLRAAAAYFLFRAYAGESVRAVQPGGPAVRG